MAGSTAGARHVEFRLLGPMAISADGQALPLPGAAEKALLAVLLLSPGRPVTASALIDRLWGDDPLPTDPLNALQLRVSKLRRALAGTDATVVRDGVGYRAEIAPDSVDVEAFAALVRAARARRETAPAGRPDGSDARTADGAADLYAAALGLWRGEPLADFAERPWAMVEAARLGQLRLAALTERAQLSLALGRPGDVVVDLEPVVAEDPTQETLAGLLMTALYQVGQQAAALEVFGRTRTVLDDELGLEPSAALRALHQKVLAQDESLSPAEPRQAPPLAAATASAVDRAAEPAPSAGAATARGTASNVPAVVRALIGRDQELEALRHLLAATRLVTLVGPGGAGKTVTAFTAAAELSDTYPDGAWVVRLAPVTVAAHVPLAAAEALGVPLDGAGGTGPARERLLTYLAHRRLLLVLDNCEHVVDSAARLADDVLAHCPAVTILTTSREALAVPGEVQVPLGPLPTPPPGTVPAQVLDFPAAQLFVERATGVQPALDLGEEDLAAVAAIVAALDGMPLAVELAAARVSTLSLPELAERLTDRFGLLTSGARTADARQRTLRATVDWSHDLLTEAEQTVFRRLAAFHGGWTLEAAEQVASDRDVPTDQVLDVLTRLVERHMVIFEPGRPSRYRMLETLRQYATEKLAASGEVDQVAKAHVAYFRRVADSAEWSLRGPAQADTLRRVRDELPNLRAAFAWLAVREQDETCVEDALHLAGALGWFWHLGRHVEGRDVLRRVAALEGGSPAARARALQAVSLVERPRACLVHPSPRCAETAAASLELFEQLGDQRRAAVSRVLLAVEGVSAQAGDERAARSRALLAEAEKRFTEDDDAWGHAIIAFVRMETYLKTGDAARAVATGQAGAAAFRSLDDPWGLSAVLYHLGWGLRQFGRYAEAVPVLEEAVDVALSAGLHNTALWATADLGIALVHLGDADAARARFDAAETGSQDTGDGAGHVLAAYGYGLLARIAGDWAQARRWFGEALAGFEALGTPVSAGLAMAGLARCDEQEGLPEVARGRYEQVLGIGESAGEPQLVAAALEGLARVESGVGDLKGAHRRLARAGTVRQKAARPLAPYERVELADLTARLSEAPA